MKASLAKKTLIAGLLSEILLVGCLSGISHAQEAAAPGSGGKVSLRLRLKPRQSFQLRVTNTQQVTRTIGDQQVEGTQTLAVDYGFEVESVDADGTARLKVAHLAVRLAKDMPSGRVEYDSADPPGQVDPLVRPLAALVGQEFRLAVTPEGRIVEVRGVDAMIDRMLQKLPGTADSRRREIEEDLAAQFGDDALKGAMARLTAIYPDGPVGVGDSWQRSAALSKGLPMRVDSTLTLTGRTGGVAVLTVESKIRPNRDALPVTLGPMNVTYDLSGKQEGEIRLDESTGLVAGATITQELSGTVQVEGPHGNPPGVSWPLTVEGKLTIADLPR